MELIYLCVFAFLAGLVDSVVGGGGLIQLPALFLLLPAATAESVPLVAGTNKLAAIMGTSVALSQYARRVRINWCATLPAGMAAFFFSFIGARVLDHLSHRFPLKLIILPLLVGVAVYTYWRKDFGSVHAPKLKASQERICALAVGTCIGFYDGFVGPGTGSFLIFAFIGIFGFDFLAASASAKVINVATNLSAVLYFASTGNILYAYALPMGACNILGSWCGARLAIWRGNTFVRGFFIVMVSAMIGWFAWDAVIAR